MNKFIIVDGLPYLIDKGKVFAVRWDESGFTVGAEVEMTSVPDRTFSELSIKAKCAGNLNSIDAPEPEQEDETTNDDGQKEPEQEDETVLDDMSLAELKEYADAHGIKLGSARTKAAIIEAIKASENAEGESE